MRPIISVKISNTKNEYSRALIDSGADVSIMKNSALNGKEKINIKEKLELNSFSNNTVMTLGTCWGCINLSNKQIKQKFHIAPNNVKMSEVEVILGKDFLINNKIIIDFGKGIIYSSGFVMSVNKQSNEIIDNGNEQNPHDKHLFSNDDIVYKTNNECMDHIKNNFGHSFVCDINNKQIILGCSKGKYFYPKTHRATSPIDHSHVLPNTMDRMRTVRVLHNLQGTGRFLRICSESNTLPMINLCEGDKIWTTNNAELKQTSLFRRVLRNRRRPLVLQNICTMDMSICSINNSNFIEYIELF